MAKLWSQREVVILTERYAQKAPIEDIARELGRTAPAVKVKAHRLEITNPASFTEEEALYIKENYKSYNLREIAKRLGRIDNYQNVCRKARELGLKRTGKKKEKTKTRMPRFKTQEDRNLYLSELTKQRIKVKGHPRGMLGKTHSKEYRKILSERVREDWANRTEGERELMKTKQNKTRTRNGTLNSQRNKNNPYSYAKGGKREDLGDVYFRSSWEANIVRIMNYKGISWEYEPKQFVFKGIYEGVMSYTPDFHLPEQNVWVEVKGWMDKKSKLRLERFKQHYPIEHSKLVLIDEDKYRKIESKYKDIINGWE